VVERDAGNSLKFHKRSQLFIGVHNEALTVVTVRVGNEDCSGIALHGCKFCIRNS